MATLNKQIKRTITKLNTSGQINLFTENIEIGIEVEKPLGSVCFIDPNPKAITLGGQRLDEQLNTVKERNAFVVRKQLKAMDFSEFEASYKPGGRGDRPHTSPRCMLGMAQSSKQLHQIPH